jgi:hypothetical protein
MGFMDDFKSADEPASNDFEIVAEGDYVAQMTDVKIDATKTPARLSITLEITSGDFKNRKMWLNYNLQGQGLGFLKKDLKTLGIDYSNVKKEEDLASIIWDASPVFVEMAVVHKEWKGKMYANAYVNGRTSATTSSEDIPF